MTCMTCSIWQWPDLSAPFLAGLCICCAAGLEAGDVLAALLHLLLQRQVLAAVQRLELLLCVCMVLPYLMAHSMTQLKLTALRPVLPAEALALLGTKSDQPKSPSNTGRLPERSYPGHTSIFGVTIARQQCSLYHTIKCPFEQRCISSDLIPQQEGLDFGLSI